MKVLAILAHPDDEVLWGWPVMQDEGTERHLLLVSDNHNGYCDRARNACCDIWPNQRRVLHNASGFYRLRFRYAVLTLPMITQVIEVQIDRVITQVQPDYVFTHNPIGEYGHGDHRLLFELVCGHPAVKKVLFTDICLANKCHVSYNEIPKHIKDAFFTAPKGEYELNMDWFNRCKQVYQRHRAWSWKGEPVSKCRLYEVDT